MLSILSLFSHEIHSLIFRHLVPVAILLNFLTLSHIISSIINKIAIKDLSQDPEQIDLREYQRKISTAHWQLFMVHFLGLFNGYTDHP